MLLFKIAFVCDNDECTQKLFIAQHFSGSFSPLFAPFPVMCFRSVVFHIFVSFSFHSFALFPLPRIQSVELFTSRTFKPRTSRQIKTKKNTHTTNSNTHSQQIPSRWQEVDARSVTVEGKKHTQIWKTSYSLSLACLYIFHIAFSPPFFLKIEI